MVLIANSPGGRHCDGSLYALDKTLKPDYTF
jgi:hypothetical protein